MERKKLIEAAAEIIRAGMQHQDASDDEIRKEAEKLTNEELKNFITANE